nr:hypothetical protein [Tanacetum cinerariifolium]
EISGIPASLKRETSSSGTARLDKVDSFRAL